MGLCYFWLVISWLVAPVLGFIIAWILLEKRLVQQRKRCESLEESLTASRKEATDLAEQLEAIGARFTQLNQQVGEKERAIAELTAEKEAYAATVAGMEAAIASKDTQIGEFDSKVESTNSHLRSLETALAERGAEIEALKGRLSQLQTAAAPDCGPDDLTKIEGIGPRISKLFVEHGILTFRALAEMPVARVKEMLAEAGLGRGDVPNSWPEQATLAAEHKWDELRVLQDHLKGGRRV
jgi:predicted flap endonuclease-1-like 5' DNA nuclease